jgi:hypothetical protein
MNKSIDISEWINRQKISGLQILVICIRGACALVEGFDAKNIGYVAPAANGDFRPIASPLHS